MLCCMNGYDKSEIYFAASDGVKKKKKNEICFAASVDMIKVKYA